MQVKKMKLFPKKQVLEEYFRNKTTLYVRPCESKLTSLLVIVSPTQIKFGSKIWIRIENLNFHQKSEFGPKFWIWTKNLNSEKKTRFKNLNVKLRICIWTKI